MNLTRCNNGHFYDLDKYVECPHCGYVIESDWIWILNDLNFGMQYDVFDIHQETDLSSTRNLKIDIEEIRGGPVLLGESKYFGCSEDCDITFANKYVSGKHFEIYSIIYRWGSIVDYFIVDLDSTNGTWLNGKRLVPNKRVKIFSGDLICVAGIYNFEFVLNKVSDNLKEKLNNSFLINEEENLHINVVKYIKNCENNPIDQGRVSKELVYYVPLKNLLIFDDFILAIREINDEFQIFIYRKDYISDSPLLFRHIKLNESLKYETAGVYDAKIWYEIMITN